MGDIRREVKDYNHAVENNSLACQREVCPRCLVCSDFARHDCTRRHFRIRVFDLQLKEFVIRFVKQDVLAKALNYLAGQPPDARASYRESLREKPFPLGTPPVRGQQT